MDPKGFLDFARELKNRNDEAALRSCVSRSYFALFNSMANFVEEHVGQLTHSAADHEKVVYYFNNCQVADVPELAIDLNSLRVDRNCSDYRLDDSRFSDKNTVTLLYKRAEIAYNNFVKIVSSSGRRKQIVQQIKEYKSKTNS
jgi:hypothetical protein